jgi:glycerol-3-phosphate dehydrogenase
MPSTASIPSAARSARHAALESTEFDVVVIGGGITGAGIAREATRRGLSVALLDADDFAAGTSSRSSKLIHGGLRYLAMGEVQLVRETALERKRVHALAPHLAEPCWMLTPAKSWAGLLKFRAGIGTYEKLGAVDPIDRHQTWRHDELEQNEPLLRRDRYAGAVAYREYLSEDARLVVAVLRDAAARGAVVQNHLRVESLVYSGSHGSASRGAGSRVVGVRARCMRSDRIVEVRGTAIVNAAGPWVEPVSRLDDPAAPSRLHLSKGIHVVIDAARLPIRHIVVLGTEDRRSIFAIPRGDSVYVGTTDVSYPHEARLWPEIGLDDVRYLLAPLHGSFDVEPLDESDVRGAWAGLRPLIAQSGKAAREMSRRDEIWVADSGLISIAGGKLTGFCKMAEDALAKVGERLGRALPLADAKEAPLPGGDLGRDLDAESAALAAATDVSPRTARRLVGLYGAEARDVVALGAEPIASLPTTEAASVLAGEIDWAVRHEAAETLIDWLYRRARVPLHAPTIAPALLAPAAARMQALLGWDDARVRDEIALASAQISADRTFASG